VKIRIRYFASLREITKQGEETLVVPDGASVTTVRTELIARYPGLQPILQRCISAVNRRYVDVETTLQDGDELVFIPPMGGGIYREERTEWNHLSS
jgi:molybdopterin converting factor subunit 1